MFVTSEIYVTDGVVESIIFSRDSIMEGVQRVYRSGIGYAKRRYLPDTMTSILYILLYTVVVYVLTEYLMKGQITRWLYIGTIIMIISMVYSGSITLDHV